MWCGLFVGVCVCGEIRFVCSRHLYNCAWWLMHHFIQKYRSTGTQTTIGFLMFILKWEREREIQNHIINFHAIVHSSCGQFEWEIYLVIFAIKIIALTIQASALFGHFACDAPFLGNGLINFFRWFITDDCI